MDNLKKVCFASIKSPVILSQVFILLVTSLFNHVDGEYFPYSSEVKNICEALTSGKEALLDLILGYSISKLDKYNKSGLMISPTTTLVRLQSTLTTF